MSKGKEIFSCWKYFAVVYIIERQVTDNIIPQKFILKYKKKQHILNIYI